MSEKHAAQVLQVNGFKTKAITVLQRLGRFFSSNSFPTRHKRNQKQEKQVEKTLQLNELKTKAIAILEPLPYSFTGIQPRIRWYDLINLDGAFSAIVEVWEDSEGKHVNPRKYEIGNKTDFVLPEYLINQRTYHIRIVIKKDEDTFASPYVEFCTDVDKAYPNRIKCGHAWGHLFLGRKNANPCCRLRKSAGFPYNPFNENSDPFNSPGMIALREALLAGDTRFCNPSCPTITTNSRTNLEKAFLASATNGLDKNAPSFQKSFQQFKEGALIVESPQQVKLSVGSYCNHACTFCKKIQVDDDWRQDEATYELLKKYAAQAQSIILTGGEPLVFLKRIKERLGEIIAVAPYLKLMIMTNGGLLKNLTPYLKDFDKLDILISLNGGTRESYKRVHRVDDFDKVLEGVKEIRQIRGEKETFIRLKLVYMRSNYKDIEVYPDLAKSVGADAVRFSNMTFFSKADADPSEEMRVTDEEWKDVKSLLHTAMLKCKEYGIKVSCRMPGEKISDSMNKFTSDWDDDADW